MLLVNMLAHKRILMLEVRRAGAGFFVVLNHFGIRLGMLILISVLNYGTIFYILVLLIIFILNLYYLIMVKFYYLDFF
jgi:hypothetical protein